MDSKNKSDYKYKYDLDNYTRCNIKMRSPEVAILTEYSQNLGISKNALLQKCLVYCYNEMIDVSSVKLSSPRKIRQNPELIQPVECHDVTKKQAFI